MSAATQAVGDVFLSHGPHDLGVAEIVKRAFDEVGLGVFALHEVKANPAFVRRMRKVLAECRALVLVLTRSNLSSPDLPFQVGMAMGVDKPIYVLHDGIGKAEIPIYLREFRVVPLAKLSEVAREIQRGQEPVSDQRQRRGSGRIARAGGANGPVPREAAVRRRTG